MIHCCVIVIGNACLRFVVYITTGRKAKISPLSLVEFAVYLILIASNSLGVRKLHTRAKVCKLELVQG